MVKIRTDVSDYYVPIPVRLTDLEEEQIVLRAFLKESIPPKKKAFIRKILASISNLIRNARQFIWNVIDVPIGLWREARNTSSFLLLSCSYCA
jgi:hypothetical protein